jgi:Family of unknown function (DUF6353)
MNKLSQLTGTVLRNVKARSPIILSVSAGVGVLTSAYLVGRASFQAAEVIRQDELTHAPYIDKKDQLKGRIKLVWRTYIPAAISTTSTILCIVGANRVGAAKTLAAQTAFAVTERAYSEYRDKVIEEFGARKDQSIRDKIVSDRVEKDPPPAHIISGPGNVLCCEMHTGRYFTSDMESLRRAQNDINAKLLKHDYATLDDLYYILGLKMTSTSGNLGWTSARQLELSFSTMLTEDNRPCITFEYNYIKPL